MAGLEKKVMYRYSGNGKFAVRKAEKREQAIERNNAYQTQISTAEGVLQYINEHPKQIGKKQMAKLNRLLTKKK